MEKIKIFLADDHQILRESLKLLLEQQEDFSVVGEAEDGLAVEPGIREHPADVLLLDVSMPKKNGFEVARSLSRDHPDLRIVFLTMHKNEKMLSEAFESGGRGYVLKENAFEELAAAIRTVNGGQIYVSPELASLMLPGFLEKQREGEDLSDRELEVLKLLAEGCSNKEIADQLHISEIGRAHV